MHYPVNELFQTLQGEGCYTGVPAIFIRLQGCPVGCPWCDTRHTWVVDPVKQVEIDEIQDHSTESDAWCRLTANEIMDAIVRLKYTAQHIVITGGEPCLYDLRALSETFIGQGYKVQLETSGTQAITIHPDVWVTVSPKIGMKGGLKMHSDALLRANEIKYPIATENDLQQFDELLESVELDPKVVIALQPISQKQRATELAMRICIARNWRLSVQMHKYLQID